MDEGNWITPGSEGSSEVRGVIVDVVRMVTDAMAPSGEGVRDGMFG